MQEMWKNFIHRFGYLLLALVVPNFTTFVLFVMFCLFSIMWYYPIPLILVLVFVYTVFVYIFVKKKLSLRMEWHFLKRGLIKIWLLSKRWFLRKKRSLRSRWQLLKRWFVIIWLLLKRWFLRKKRFWKKHPYRFIFTVALPLLLALMLSPSGFWDKLLTVTGLKYLWSMSAGKEFWLWLNGTDILNMLLPGAEAKKVAAMVSRNRGVFLLALITVGLTVWGRVMTNKQNKQAQEKIEQTKEQIEQAKEEMDRRQKSDIRDRYERASRMLYNESMSERIASCRALLALARDDNDMLSSCSGLLFSYIKEPYFGKEEKDKRSAMIDMTDDFDSATELKDDIQEAINSVSSIYKRAYDIGEKLNDKITSLPFYFWQNKKKGELCFAYGNFEYQDMREAFLTGVDLQYSNLRNTILRDANLQYANLQNAKLEGADLCNAVLDYIKSQSASLQYAKLENAKLRWAELQNANLQGVNLKNTRLEGTELQNTKLMKAKLEDATLIMTKLQNANLSDAKLQNTKLYSADLQSAKLRGANLQGADLDWANLQEADLRFADLTDATLGEAKKLTKRQILSAGWATIDKEGNGEAPTLPNELMEDAEIQKWCETPALEWKDDEWIIKRVEWRRAKFFVNRKRWGGRELSRARRARWVV